MFLMKRSEINKIIKEMEQLIKENGFHDSKSNGKRY